MNMTVPTFTRMPYTALELVRACELIVGRHTASNLRDLVDLAFAVGVSGDRSYFAPSMRVVLQANIDMQKHGEFRFGK